MKHSKPHAYDPPSAAMVASWAAVQAGGYDSSYWSKFAQLSAAAFSANAAWITARSERRNLAARLSSMQDDMDPEDPALAARLRAEYDAELARHDQLNAQLQALKEEKDEAWQRHFDFHTAGPAGWEAERQAAFEAAAEIDAMRDAYRVKKLGQVDAYYDNRVADLTADKDAVQGDMDALTAEVGRLVSKRAQVLQQRQAAWEADDWASEQEHSEKHIELADRLWEVYNLYLEKKGNRDALQDEIDAVEALQASGEWETRKQAVRAEMIADLAAQTDYDSSWYNAYYEAEKACWEAEPETEIAAADEVALDASHKEQPR